MLLTNSSQCKNDRIISRVTKVQSQRLVLKNLNLLKKELNTKIHIDKIRSFKMMKRIPLIKIAIQTRRNQTSRIKMILWRDRPHKSKSPLKSLTKDCNPCKASIMELYCKIKEPVNRLWKIKIIFTVSSKEIERSHLNFLNKN